MKNLLALLSIGILVLPSATSQLQTNLIATQSVTNQVISPQEQKFESEIVISNKKHIEDGKIVTGTEDYKKEFEKGINNLREEIKQIKGEKDDESWNWTIYAKFDSDEDETKKELSNDAFDTLLTAKKIEILSTDVTITEVANDQNEKVKLYKYDIEYTAKADSKEITKNINVYESDVLSTEYLLSPYRIFFEADIYDTLTGDDYFTIESDYSKPINASGLADFFNNQASGVGEQIVSSTVAFTNSEGESLTYEITDKSLEELRDALQEHGRNFLFPRLVKFGNEYTFAIKYSLLGGGVKDISLSYGIPEKLPSSFLDTNLTVEYKLFLNNI